MPLHPTVAEFIKNLPPPAPGPLNPEMMRAFDESHVAPIEERLPVYEVIDSSVADIPVRIYRPSAAEHYDVLVYFHGGAFFLGSLNTHDHVARELATATQCVVVSVGYRLAPEHAFPAGLHDCYAVVESILKKGRDNQQICWSGNMLALAGDSSGGNFVAAVAAMAVDKGLTGITHQILYYPSVDLDFDDQRYESLRTNGVGYGLETAGLKPFNAFYIESGANPDDPLVSPIKRKSFTSLPKALVITAEFDPLRDEGEVYADHLSKAGVAVKLHRYVGAGHGFIQHFSWLPEFHGVYAETAEFLRG